MKTAIALMVMGVLLLAGCQTQVADSKDEKIDSATEAEESAALKSEAYQVVIENLKYMPTDLEIKVGDTVEWVNKDKFRATVTFDNGLLDENLPPGGTVRYTFLEKGRFTYQNQFSENLPEDKELIEEEQIEVEKEQAEDEEQDDEYPTNQGIIWVN